MSIENMKRLGLFAAMAALLAFAGCTKDKSFFMRVSTEDYQGAGKAYIAQSGSSYYACWENGDAIRITTSENVDITSSISVSHSGGRTTCSVSSDQFNTPAAGTTVRAGYPATMFGSGVNCSSATSIDLPATSTYTTVSGNQKLNAPMVASLTKTQNEDELKFVNLCALLKVHLLASVDAATVDSVKVERFASDGSTPKQMSGAATLSFSGHTPSLALSGTASNNSVTLVLGDNAIALTSSTSADVYIPIPPLERGDKICVSVHNALHTDDMSDDDGWFEISYPVSTALPGNVIAPITAKPIDEASIYTFYNYLQNTASGSYIDLGVKPTIGSKMEMKFVINDNLNAQHYYSGARHTDGLYFSLTKIPSQSRFALAYLSSHDDNVFFTSAINNVTTGTKYRLTSEIKQDNSNLCYASGTFERLNFTTEATEAIETGDTPNHRTPVSESSLTNIFVFASGTSNTTSAGLRLYSYNISQNGTMVHNFVPATKVENNITLYGVYDKVTRQFIQGTGSFTVGND